MTEDQNFTIGKTLEVNEEITIFICNSSFVTLTYHMNLPKLDPILKELSTCSDEATIKEFHSSYLWKKWSINLLFKDLKSLSPEEKKTKGQEIKALFTTVQEAFFAQQDSIKKAYRDAQLQKEIIDISTPGNSLPRGYGNLQNKLRRTVEEIFQWMWFHIEYGHDLVSVHENFETVNIPATHPATEMFDTLYVKTDTTNPSQKKVLRTHTSAHQNELIKKYGPKCKFVIPGKVYRNENMDASHDVAFWQLEGVVIDKGISIGHFKWMMHEILQAILETDKIELRMRPWYFPFVEPGFEIDAKVEIGWKVKRLEILWAWMIHPSVLEQAWVDPTEYSGFAFWLWLTRMVAIRYGIWDVRLLTNGDLRFLHSFA